MLDTSYPPVVVLCGHRTGSSYLTSVLAAAGLELGEVIRPDSGNALGYWENQAALAANKSVLNQLGRDWTNPPLRLEPGELDHSEVADAVREMSVDGHWGFKDPRTIFTLPIWSTQIPQFRFVGVYRATTLAADSLVRRNGLAYEDAFAIADRYAQRLRHLHQSIEFPVVNFDAPTELRQRQLSAMLQALDLSADAAEVDLFADSAPANPEGGAHVTETDEYFSSLPLHEGPAKITSSHGVVTILRSDESREGNLPHYLGPHFRERRDRYLRRAIGKSPEGRWLEITLSPERQTGRAYIGLPDSTASVASFLASSDFSGRFSCISAVDVLDQVAPSRLGEVFGKVRAALRPDGSFVASGFVTDLPVDGDRVWPGRWQTDSSGPTFHHSYDHLMVAAEGAGLYLVHTEREPWGTMAAFFQPVRPRTAVYQNPVELRDELREAKVSVAELQASNADLNTSASKAKEAGTRAEAELERARAEASNLAADLATKASQLATVQEQRDSAVSTVNTARSKLRKTRQRLRATQAELQASQTHARNLSATLTALQSRRGVRIAMAGSRRLGPVYRAALFVPRRVRSLRGSRLPSTLSPVPQAEVAAVEAPRPGVSPELAQQRLAEQIVSAREGAGNSVSGPLVTIVIITRDGVHHMRRVLDGLAHRTAYQTFEVIVVDNDSSDDTLEVCHQSWPFEVSVIANESNRSFSEANNQAVEQAQGQYVLFLNNDVDPINPGWLGAMVDALVEDPDRGAAGALLIYPEPEAGDLAAHAKPLMVQHAGIRFRYEKGTPKGYNVGHGEDPLAVPPNDVSSYPGVTAACMLVEVQLLRDLGSFTDGYVYGTEDVDLCLKIRNAGRDIVTVAGAALFHHEFGTQDTLAHRVKQINRSWNRTLFLETWGPSIERLMSAERFGGERFWPPNEKPRVAITLTKDDEAAGWGDYYTAHELGDAMEAIGWDVVYAERFADRWYELDESIDLVISLLDACDVRRLPPSAVKLAWVRNWVDRWLGHPWFEDFDLVASSSDTSARLIRAGSAQQPFVVPLATNPDRFAPQPTNVTYKSDYAFTGNHWGVNRELIDMLSVGPEEKFVLFGKGWDTVPRVQRYWRGHAEYDDLPKVYSSTKIVLDDTAGPTLPYGAVNSRVFDALASGALVITDNVVGSEEVFEGLLPTYETRDELRAHLDTYLHDDAGRAELASKLRSMVLARHTYPRLAEELVDAVQKFSERPKVRMKIGPPTWEVAEEWGDTHFARHFLSALDACGFSTAIDVLADWDSPETLDAEIVIHLRGLVPYVPKRGQVNVLWVISHPGDVSGRECDEYDLVFVASEPFAETLRQSTSTPVVTMLQATSPSVFMPLEPDPDLQTDLLFVGNSRGVLRPAVDMAIEQGLPLKVYGSGWSGLIPEEYVVAEYFPNERLAELYSSTKLLLNDHWDDMREEGFVSNRIFDALGCGTVTLTDAVKGLDHLLPVKLPQYDDAESLAEAVKLYLEDDALRSSVGAKGREAVLEKHTFAHRAQTFADMVRPLLADQRSKISL